MWWRSLGLIVVYLRIPVTIKKGGEKIFDLKSGAMQPFSHLGARPEGRAHLGKGRGGKDGP